MQLFRGYTLLEVLIALLISALLFLGIGATQIKILRYAQLNYHYTLANQQLANLFEQSLLVSDTANIIEEINYLLPKGKVVNSKICWQEKDSEICL